MHSRFNDILTCSQCKSQQRRPYELAHSTFVQQPFVCENCRCKDCSIVLNIVCDCGSLHAEPSKEDPRVCVECILIRERVANLDPDLLRLRNNEIANQESVYTIPLTADIIPCIVPVSENDSMSVQDEINHQNSKGDNIK